MKQLFRYTSGPQETPADRPIIQRSLTKTFRDSGFRFKELMVALVKSIEFPQAQRRRQMSAVHH